MAYLGNGPGEAYTNTVKDSFNGDGSTTAFTMSVPSSTNDVRVVVENVVQDPTVAYSCAGTTLTFTSAPPSGTANIYVIHLGLAVMTTVPPSEISDATVFSSNVTVQGAFTSQGIDDNANSTAITIDSSENVGIGADNPTTKFQSRGGSVSTVTNNAGLIADASASFIVNHSNEYGLYTGYINASNDTIGVAATRSGGSALPLSLQPFGGNVGIGTSSPSDELHINSTASNVNLRLTRDTNTGARISGSDGDSSPAVIFETISGGTSTERMRIDSSGAVTMPSQPAFLASNSVAQNNIAINAGVTVNFTEVFDQGSDFAANTFTAPVTGKYQLNATIRISNLDTAATYYQLVFISSNGNYEFGLITPNFTSDLTYLTFSGAILLDMDAGDTSSIQVVQVGGTSQSDLSQNTCDFSGYLVA